LVCAILGLVAILFTAVGIWLAGKLFVSLSAIKNHVSGILEKLGIKRRIQAIEKAKTVGLLP
jgi:ATP/maltotriose-dependent transcriptional regulator MalT